MSVHVQEAGGGDPTPLERSRWHDQLGVAYPNDGALAGLSVDENERHLAQRPGDGDEITVDASFLQLAPVKIGRGVVADAADIVRSQPPSLTGNHGGGDLPAGHDLGTEHFELGAEGGELRETQDRVRGIFADTEDVKSWLAHKVVVQSIGRGEECKESCECCVRPIIIGEAAGQLTESGALRS